MSSNVAPVPNCNAMIGKHLLLIDARDPVEQWTELVCITHAVPRRMRESMDPERMMYGVYLGHWTGDDFDGLVAKSSDKSEMERDAKEVERFFDKVLYPNTNCEYDDSFVKLSMSPPIKVDVMITIHSE